MNNPQADAFEGTVEPYQRSQFPPSIEECYLVWPDKDSLETILVLADPAEEGQDAIAGHFPRLKLAMDLDQLAQMEDVARNGPMFSTGFDWFRKPIHFFFIAIEDGVPVSKFVVRSRDLGKAIAKAAQVAPGCKFNIVGSLEQFREGGNALIEIAKGNTEHRGLDLRDPDR